jgi:hypothetical protein
MTGHLSEGNMIDPVRTRETNRADLEALLDVIDDPRPEVDAGLRVALRKWFGVDDARVDAFLRQVRTGHGLDSDRKGWNA